MITVSNYRKKTNNLDFSKLPSYLGETHQEMMEFYLDTYHKDQTIKETVDLYLKQLNDQLNKEAKAKAPARAAPKPKPKKKGTSVKKAKAKKQAPKAPIKVTGPKRKSAKKPPAIRSKSLMRSFDQELKLIKGFYNLLNKEVAGTRWVNLHRRLQKAIAEGSVHPNSKYHDLIKLAAAKALKVVNAYKKDPSIPLEVHLESSSEYQKFEISAKRTAIWPSVRLFKRFIGMQGGNPSKQQLNNLIRAIERAVANKSVMGSDPFAQELKQALTILKANRSAGTVEAIGLSMNSDLCSCMEYATGRPFYKAPSKKKTPVVPVKPAAGQSLRKAPALKVKAQLEKILFDILKRAPFKVSETPGPAYSLSEDLHLGEIDLVELVMSLEKVLGIDIPDDVAERWEITGEVVDDLYKLVTADKSMNKNVLTEYLDKASGKMDKVFRNTQQVLDKTEQTIGKVQQGKRLMQQVTGLPDRILSASDFLSMKFEKMNLPKPWDEFLNNIPTNFRIMVFGQGKNGKTSLCIQMAEMLSKKGVVMYNLADEGISATAQETMRKSGITKNSNVFFTQGKDLKQLREDIRLLDPQFIFIDLMTTYRVQAFEVERLMKEEFPDKGFILVMMANKDDTYKGQSDWFHIVDAKIFCKEFVAYNSGRYGMGEYDIWPEYNAKKKAEQEAEEAAKNKENKNVEQPGGMNTDKFSRTKAINHKAREIRKKGEPWNKAVKRAARLV